MTLFKFGIITLFPSMFEALNYGVIGRALTQQLITLNFFNPRDFTTDSRQTVDDRPYGGGPGMVMKCEPLYAAIQAAKTALGQATKVILLSPQGQPLQQHMLADITQSREKANSIILIAGRYEGIDERVIEAVVEEEWSVGDYVLTGGELPAMICIDAITRLLPNVLGHEDSAAEDSFASGLLDYPHYTRPEVTLGKSVPKVLLSGDHAVISTWRKRQALGRTWTRRPDLLAKRGLTAHEHQLLNEYIHEYEQEKQD